MTVRFLADEDLDSDIIDGLRSRELAIDILDVKKAGLRGRADAVLLELAAQEDRILITHDRRTMTRYVRERVAAGRLNAGVFIVPQRSAIGETIEALLLVWMARRRRNGVIRSCTSPSAEDAVAVDGGGDLRTTAAPAVEVAMQVLLYTGLVAGTSNT